MTFFNSGFSVESTQCSFPSPGPSPAALDVTFSQTSSQSWARRSYEQEGTQSKAGGRGHSWPTSPKTSFHYTPGSAAPHSAHWSSKLLHDKSSFWSNINHVQKYFLQLIYPEVPDGWLPERALAALTSNVADVKFQTPVNFITWEFKYFYH